jgi:superfamily II DNA or RNA helicase
MGDSTFITNEGENTLENLFIELIKNTKYFDCLVGYFYASGFFRLYKQLEDTDKIRILIGISTNKQTFDMLSSSRTSQAQLRDSVSEVKTELENQIVEEYEKSKDTLEVEEGTKKFIEWIRSGKLEIKAYPDQNIHAKLYIFTSKGGGFGDEGRVITGSSNLTEAGLNKNLEFNVVLKRKEDYENALARFENLWDSAVEVSDKYVQTIQKKTWINSEISPYYLFLKFLYEYLKDKIDEDKEELGDDGYKPENFMDLRYQLDAVRDAKSKLLEYGGVFISDVVGLGKTYIATMLAKELEYEDGPKGGTLVIAPPILIDEKNPGSWNNAFNDFGVRKGKFYSRGSIDKIPQEVIDKYKNVIIDEAHSFRNEATGMYEQLYRVCKGKRIVLVSATPLNNTPMDILAQLKLFQNSRKSMLPSPEVRDLESFFKKLQARLKGMDRQENKEEYFKIIKENAKEIREKVLKYVMVRRTRSSIEKYYKDDLNLQGLKFPQVVDPEPIIYKFDEELDRIFGQTLKLIIEKFSYVRYTPLLYLKNQNSLTNLEKGSQRNMGNFMKGVLLKRLESSFYAFKKTIDRFIRSHESFISAYEKGHVYFSKKHLNKLLDYIDTDDYESLNELIEDDKAKEFEAKDFTEDFIIKLKEDFETLKEIQHLWKDINYDPKLEEFERRLSKDKILKENKIVVFTESKETAEYLEDKLRASMKCCVRSFSSSSDENLREEVIENFDARKKDKDTIKILITTDILAEGVNLHRANVVMNYDIPWNPTRMMQRVGRINRVDTKHDKIYTYNFFPAGNINDPLKLTEAAEAKINAFIEMLGNDAKLLTDEEIKSHDLFAKLNSKESILKDENEGEDVELKYLTFLREIRDHNPHLYEKIIKLPKKSRTSKKVEGSGNSLVTFFRKGKLRKIFFSSKSNPVEIDLAEAVKLIECDENTKPEKLDERFYEYLEKNKEAFDEVFEIEENRQIGSGRSNEFKLIKKINAIKDSSELSDEQKDYLRDVLNLLTDGGMAKKTAQKLARELAKDINPQKIVNKLKTDIPEEYFKSHPVNSAEIRGPKEVILSEYLIGGN